MGTGNTTPEDVGVGIILELILAIWTAELALERYPSKSDNVASFWMRRELAMMIWARLLGIVVAMSMAAPGQVAPLKITTESIIPGAAGVPYQYRLQAEGGARPYLWTISDGKLPVGLTLDSKTGEISGLPASGGNFMITVRLGDSSSPAQAVQRTYTIQLRAMLSIEWKESPQVRTGGIFGSCVVSNGSEKPFDMTVIVLAVNETGRATALGYQHFVLNPRSSSPLISFGSTLPDGKYAVHADAVAEVPSVNAIYRVRLQTQPIEVKRQP